jgi:hypothetical protein
VGEYEDRIEQLERLNRAATEAEDEDDNSRRPPSRMR